MMYFNMTLYAIGQLGYNQYDEIDNYQNNKYMTRCNNQSPNKVRNILIPLTFSRPIKPQTRFTFLFYKNVAKENNLLPYTCYVNIILQYEYIRCQIVPSMP